MARVPKVGDAVVRRGSLVTYVVTGTSAAKKTADIEDGNAGIGLHQDVPWSELSFLVKRRGYPDRRGMGAESDVVAEQFVPSERYKEQQKNIVQTLLAAGLKHEQIQSMLLVPVEPPLDKKPEDEKPKDP